MDATQRRKNEIEAKKAKLAELRRQRSDRQLVPTPVPSAPPSRTFARKDIDQLVNSLIGDVRLPSRSESRVSSSSRTDARTEQDADPSALVIDQPTSREVKSVSTQVVGDEDKENVQVNSSGPAPTTMVETPVRTHIPIEVITYVKGTQTDLNEDVDETTDDLSQLKVQAQVDSDLNQLNQRILELEHELEIAKALPESTAKRKAITTDTVDLRESDFDVFVDRSSKVLERALQEDYNVLYDYAKGMHTQRTRNEGLNQIHLFTHASTTGRPIVAIDWSPHYSELILCAYRKKRSTENGLVHIWNLHAKQPEYTFSAHSDLNVARFHGSDPHIVLAGSLSGHIYVWDTRSGPRAIRRTPLCNLGYTYPIVHLETLGANSINTIQSTNSNGHVHTWSMEMLAEPLESLQLFAPLPSKYEYIVPTCMSVDPSNGQHSVVGTEDGHIYPINRQSSVTSAAGTSSKIVYKGHRAPITGIHHHPNKYVDVQAFITSSMDWNLMLWQNKSENDLEIPMTLAPFATIELTEAVYDVQWSPARPGTCACVDGSGRVQVFDLAKDMDTASARATCDGPLYRLAWSNDGRRLGTGSLDGALTIFQVGDALSGKDVKADHWQRFANKLKTVATN